MSKHYNFAHERALDAVHSLERLYKTDPVLYEGSACKAILQVVEILLDRLQLNQEAYELEHSSDEEGSALD